MEDFLFSDNRDAILKKLKKTNGNTTAIATGTAFLQMRLQQDLLENQEKKHKELLKIQNEYNEKQLFWTRLLTLGTWALVIVTYFLIQSA